MQPRLSNAVAPGNSATARLSNRERGVVVVTGKGNDRQRTGSPGCVAVKRHRADGLEIDAYAGQHIIEKVAASPASMIGKDAPAPPDPPCGPVRSCRSGTACVKSRRAVRTAMPRP